MRSQRWTALILVAPLSFLLWGFFQIYHKSSAYGTVADKLPVERAAAKRQGIPLTPEDLIRTPPVPSAQNAAPLYREITASLQQMQPASWDGVRPVILNQATEADRRMTRLLLDQYRSIMERAEQASRLQDCDFQRDWKLGVNVPFPEYSYLRQIVRLYAAQATLQCDTNQPLNAFHSLLIAARIARHMGQDSCVNSLMTRAMMASTIDRPLIRTIQIYGNRSETLQLATQIEELIGEPFDLEKGLRGECVVRLQTLTLLRKNDPHALAPGYAPLYPPHASKQIVLDAWEVHCLSYWRGLMSGVSSVEGDPMETYRVVKAATVTENAEIVGVRKHLKPTYEMSPQLESDYSDVAQRLVVIEARHRLRQTLIGLLAYRLQKGQFPEKLTELKPLPPEDPFARQPLHYRKTKTGFLLYSVGINLADDNGDGGSRIRGGDPPDIVIAFPPTRLGGG